VDADTESPPPDRVIVAIQAGAVFKWASTGSSCDAEAPP
jgi:hypothetical protein